MMLTVRNLSKIESILDFFATPQICGIPGIQSRFEKKCFGGSALTRNGKY